MEDWKTLKTWKGHHSRSKLSYYLINFLAISDLAWSPDNLHFASCSTDSTISIWHVNEHCKFKFSFINLMKVPLRILECKANGLTFDPFGKFLAS